LPLRGASAGASLCKLRRIVWRHGGVRRAFTLYRAAAYLPWLISRPRHKPMLRNACASFSLRRRHLACCMNVAGWIFRGLMVVLWRARNDMLAPVMHNGWRYSMSSWKDVWFS